MASDFKAIVRRYYTGSGPHAVRFRYFLIVFDVATILFFIITAPIADRTWLSPISLALGLVILADFSARIWIAENRAHMLKQIYTIADLIVIVSLFLDPFFVRSLAFLRILRGLRLIHSYHLLGDLRRDSVFFRTHEDAVIATINLFVFVFVTASTAHALFFTGPEGLGSYVDALYFTVATLTTTGYGDITLATAGGKIFSVVIMVVGVILFVQLGRAIFYPQKVHHTCRDCGLTRHEPDAVHCKHCGGLLKIMTSGT